MEKITVGTLCSCIILQNKWPLHIHIEALLLWHFVSGISASLERTLFSNLLRLLSFSLLHLSRSGLTSNSRAAVLLSAWAVEVFRSDSWVAGLCLVEEAETAEGGGAGAGICAAGAGICAASICAAGAGICAAGAGICAASICAAGAGICAAGAGICAASICAAGAGVFKVVCLVGWTG